MSAIDPSATVVCPDEPAVRRPAFSPARTRILRLSRRRGIPGSIHLVAAGLGALIFAGCATYRPLPLPAAPDLSRGPALTVPAARLGLPGLTSHAIDPRRPLDETTVITLAVLNNPELKARRLETGVADAQLLEAGLLPDPRISGGLSRSAVRGGYSVGLAEDLRALIIRGTARAAARAHRRKVNLEILWQEWQVAARAQQLFIRACADHQLHTVLARDCDLFRRRLRADAEALRRSDVTANVASADLAAESAAEARLRGVELDANQTRHALNGLLGLDPSVKLSLASPQYRRPLSAANFRAAVAALPRRRADLLALQAGYRSRELRLREAILAQFPSVNAGVEQARSAEEGVHTVGLTVNLTLPLFNRNRGRIAVGRATRAELRQTYQARLDQAVGEADQVWKATQILERHDRHLAARLAGLHKAAEAAEQELRRGDLDLGTYLKMNAALLSARADRIRLHAALEQARATLRILLAMPFATR